MSSCSSDSETTIHFFLHCANFNIQRQTLFNEIATMDANILTENEDSIVNTLLFIFSDNQGYLIHTPGTLFSVCLFCLISIFI